MGMDPDEYDSPPMKDLTADNIMGQPIAEPEFLAYSILWRLLFVIYMTLYANKIVYGRMGIRSRALSCMWSEMFSYTTGILPPD